MFYLQNSSACLCLVLSLLTSSRPTLCGITRYRPIQRSCGVEEPSTGLQDTHRWLHENEVLDNDLWNSTNMPQGHGHTASDRQQQQPHHRRQTLTPLYTIDTYFHIIADSSSAPTSSTSYISDSMIAAQFRYLAQAYTGAAIGFRLAGIDRSTNDTWASNGDDLGMKRTLRRGSYASLNIYYQSELQSAPGTPGVPAGSTLLGYCSLPAAGITVASPRDAYVLDGCNVLSGTMPGGSVGAYNLGGTTAHEVGHWNGLLHTFTGNSCDAGDFGDYVADTPQEMTSTAGCPSSKDSCPTSGSPQGSYTGAAPAQGSSSSNPYGPQGYSGPDPIHNFMDYSTDACYTGFTPGQGARMLNIWRIYREGL